MSCYDDRAHKALATLPAYDRAYGAYTWVLCMVLCHRVVGVGEAFQYAFARLVFLAGSRIPSALVSRSCSP